MRRRRIVAFLSLLLIAGGIAFALWCNALPQRMEREADRIFAGDRLNWEELQQQMDQICRREGTNAIPTILDWIEAVALRPPPGRVRGFLYQVSDNYRDWEQGRFEWEFVRSITAATALRVYGPESKSVALPRLLKMKEATGGRGFAVAVDLAIAGVKEGRITRPSLQQD